MPNINEDCLICVKSNTYYDSNTWICPSHTHEWPPQDHHTEPELATLCKDAHGNLLKDGGTVILIKDLRVKGSSLVIKGGTKIKNIRITDGDHDIDCKIDGQSLLLRSEFLKKS
jgi:protein PhnA